MGAPGRSPGTLCVSQVRAPPVPFSGALSLGGWRRPPQSCLGAGPPTGVTGLAAGTDCCGCTEGAHAERLTALPQGSTDPQCSLFAGSVLGFSLLWPVPLTPSQHLPKNVPSHVACTGIPASGLCFWAPQWRHTRKYLKGYF